MKHSFLKSVRVGEYVDCVYVICDKRETLDVQLANPRVSRMGDKYIFLHVKDNSLPGRENATVFFYFKNDSDVAFLRSDSPRRSSYVFVSGKVTGAYPDIKITARKIVSAGVGSDLVFDTGDLYGFDERIKADLLSPSGRTGVHIRHTSVDEFQDNSDLIREGDQLSYKRLVGSPHDRYQINVFVEGIDEVFNVPAWMTPTMATMIDEGYAFAITVSRVSERDEDASINSGLVVTIKAAK